MGEPEANLFEQRNFYKDGVKGGVANTILFCAWDSGYFLENIQCSKILTISILSSVDQADVLIALNQNQ